MKKGQPPSMPGSSRRPDGRRKSSTSCPRANCGRRVSSFVETTTVLDRWGSTCTGRARPFLNAMMIPPWHPYMMVTCGDSAVRPFWGLVTDVPC